MTRAKEILKNIVIVVLFLSSLLLVLMALPASIVFELPLPDALVSVLGVVPEEPAATAEKALFSAASPIQISVRHDGGRHTAKRDAAALSAAYDALAVYLGRALTTAQAPCAISPEDFSAALEENGVLFTFAGDIPAEAVSRWLTGENGAVQKTAGDYLLIREKNKVSLLVLGESPTKYETSVSAVSLFSVLETFTPDGSGFSASRDTTLHPLTLWEPDVSLPNYTAESPVTGDFATSLATALDFNPYGSGVYTDPEGNTIYSETDRTLTVSPGGGVTLNVTEPGLALYTAQEDSAAARIETARFLLDVITQNTLGEAQLQLAAVEGDTLCFTYLLNGVPVLPAACQVTFRERNLAELTITLRSFHPATGQSRLMPLTSAAAIADKNARLTPAYTLSAAPGWAAQ